MSKGDFRVVRRVQDDGESLKGNWKELNGDGDTSKSDVKALKG